MEKKYNPPKVEFWAGMFHMFLSLTILSFICHVVGLGWFSSSNVSLKIPSELAQKFINCGLNVIELIFVYKILIREHSLLCSIVAVLQAVFVGFAPSVFQGLINMSCMCLLTVILRKDHVHGLIDFVVLAILMTLYAAFLIALKLTIPTAYSYVCSGIFGLIIAYIGQYEGESNFIRRDYAYIEPEYNKLKEEQRKRNVYSLSEKELRQYCKSYNLDCIDEEIVVQRLIYHLKGVALYEKIGYSKPQMIRREQRIENTIGFSLK